MSLGPVIQLQNVLNCGLITFCERKLSPRESWNQLGNYLLAELVNYLSLERAMFNPPSTSVSVGEFKQNIKGLRIQLIGRFRLNFINERASSIWSGLVQTSLNHNMIIDFPIGSAAFN